MLTVDQMYNAVFARLTERAAKVEECTAQQYISDYSPDDSYCATSLAKYNDGKAALQQYDMIIHRDRTTIKPTPADNQIVIDAGFIATSPAYSLVSFSPKK